MPTATEANPIAPPSPTTKITAPESMSTTAKMRSRTSCFIGTCFCASKRFVSYSAGDWWCRFRGHWAGGG